jgi:hypothetical protein
MYYFTNIVEIYALACQGAFRTLFLIFWGCPLSSMYIKYVISFYLLFRFSKSENSSFIAKSCWTQLKSRPRILTCLGQGHFVKKGHLGRPWPSWPWLNSSTAEVWKTMILLTSRRSLIRNFNLSIHSHSPQRVLLTDRWEDDWIINIHLFNLGSNQIVIYLHDLVLLISWTQWHIEQLGKTSHLSDSPSS